MTTIGDVAVRAGVSTATVSRALNGKASVDAQLAERVRTAAAELNYRPNGPARSLRRKSTTTLSLLVPDISTPLFAAMSHAFEDVATRAGYSVVFGNTTDDADVQRRHLQVAADERLAGVALVAANGRLDEADVDGIDVPLLLACSAGTELPYDKVTVDVAGVTVQAVADMLDAGYRRIGCITGQGCVGRLDQVLTGYRTALAGAGRPVEPNLIRHIRTPGAVDDVAAMLTGPDAPDALLVADDAPTVLRAARDGGRKIGSDLGVVVFDDDRWAALMTPPLSTVTLPAEALGRTAARTLLARIENPERSVRHVELDARYTARASSERTQAHARAIVEV